MLLYVEMESVSSWVKVIIIAEVHDYRRDNDGVEEGRMGFLQTLS
jgi:hypothetical protein